MIKVIDSKCIGCGLCANMCASVFKMNSQNKSEVISENDMACANEAAKSCPVNAIEVN